MLPTLRHNFYSHCLLAESDGELSPIFKRKLSAERPLNNINRANITPGTQHTVLKTFVQKPTTTISVRTLSKPLFVGAPSPEAKEEESPNEADNDESSSESPLGGMSMKTLINKTSPTKRTLNSSDQDDSQDSPFFYPRVVSWWIFFTYLVVFLNFYSNIHFFPIIIILKCLYLFHCIEITKYIPCYHLFC